MNDDQKSGGLAALAGLGVALGSVAVGAYLSNRTKSTGSDDAPFYTGRHDMGDNAIAGRTVTIRKPASELFAWWKDFANLPQVMENVEAIQKKGGPTNRAVWTIKAPAGQTVDVETEISEEQENRLIAWKSVEGSDIDTIGRVTFEDAPGDRGTRVRLVVSYDAPAGKLGQAIAKVFLREPEVQARHDLKRFKMLMETGEIATSARRKDETRAAKQENA